MKIIFMYKRPKGLLCYKENMKIGEIYMRYDIMPNLAEHQLRVASVAKYLCDHMRERMVNEKDLVSACLIHDMGNIIKADLGLFPEFITPAMRPHYEKVKALMMEQYADEHEATLSIAGELGVNDVVLLYLENARFSKYNEVETDLGKKIYNYADMRVYPFGIVPLQERLDDLRKRYENKETRKKLPSFDREAFEKRMHEFESDIFSVVDCRPEDITDTTIAPFVEELQKDDIETLAS